VQALAALWYAAVTVVVYGDDGPPEVGDQAIWLLPLVGMGLWIGYLAAPSILRLITSSQDRGVDFGLTVSPRQGMVAVAVGVGSQLLALPVIYFVVLRLFPDDDPSEVARQLIDRVDGPIDVVLLVLAVVVAAPLAEEWFYRGLLFPAIGRRFGAVAGVIGSSLLFTLVHPDPITFPGLFLFAVVLAWLTWWSGRLGTAVLAHMAFNATTVVQLLLFV
jgi:membrane protease YdiL (CAAX protease family)